MNRLDFLSTTLLSALGLPLAARSTPESAAIIRPPFLREGDRIAITSPAGFVTEKDVQPAVALLRSWGFGVELGRTIGKRAGSFGGSDEERTSDLQHWINSTQVKAILCARGGYGAVRIVDRLDFSPLLHHPKWIIGFSDITVLHCHLNRRYGIASLHAKMTNSFPEDWNKADALQQETILTIRDALLGKPMEYSAPPHPLNRLGHASGPLVGGNLRTIENLAGSASDLRTVNKILFVEDTGEYLYSIDRMFRNLQRSGKLDHLAGLIIGGFKIKPSEDPSEEFGRKLEEIVLDVLPDCNYPVCFDFPVGHQRNNRALRCGMTHHLRVSNTGSILNG
ncbi:MAG TPA: LD-carboxypeptidase [Lacibacter sp.]|nr:LD-carboxypeptidase [Lacibacter sp.]HMO88823.1 LD-carboxypeptidase [Lacibacter sp.]